MEPLMPKHLPFFYPQDCLIGRNSMQEEDGNRHNTFQIYLGKDGPKNILLHYYRKDKSGTEQNVILQQETSGIVRSV